MAHHREQPQLERRVVDTHVPDQGVIKVIPYQNAALRKRLVRPAHLLVGCRVLVLEAGDGEARLRRRKALEAQLRVRLALDPSRAAKVAAARAIERIRAALLAIPISQKVRIGIGIESLVAEARRRGVDRIEQHLLKRAAARLCRLHKDQQLAWFQMRIHGLLLLQLALRDPLSTQPCQSKQCDATTADQVSAELHSAVVAA